MPLRIDHVHHESSEIKRMKLSLQKFRKSSSRKLKILTLFTSLGLKDRHNNAAPGSSPVFISFPVSQMVLYLVHVEYKEFYLKYLKYLAKRSIHNDKMKRTEYLIILTLQMMVHYRYASCLFN